MNRKLTIASGAAAFVAIASLMLTPARDARATTCGVDDCTGSTEFTFHCCIMAGFRCKIYDRRVCAVSPAGYQYEKKTDVLAESCSTTTPVPKSQPLSCNVPEDPPGGG